MAKLKESEISSALKEKIKGWEHDGDEIKKVYTFKDFNASIKFVNHLAGIAESINHHPDIKIQYNKVTLNLSTHDEGGITNKDIKLAQKADEIV